MSRSYRKPYAAVTGIPRSHDDKKAAARGVRRKQNQWLSCLGDYDRYLIPHRFECTWNNTWCWARDGRQSLIFPNTRSGDRNRFMRRYWLDIQRK